MLLIERSTVMQGKNTTKQDSGSWLIIVSAPMQESQDVCVPCVSVEVRRKTVELSCLLVKDIFKYK
jgi:hypothetical protein